MISSKNWLPYFVKTVIAKLFNGPESQWPPAGLNA